MPGRALCFLTLPEALGGELELGSTDDALVGAHLCDLQHSLGQLGRGLGTGPFTHSSGTLFLQLREMRV